MKAGQSLAQVIRARMQERGWTLQAVADRSGLSVATIWALREGTRGKRPHLSTLQRLADGLDLPASALVHALDGTEGGDLQAAREAAMLRTYRSLDAAGKRAVEERARALAAQQGARAVPRSRQGGGRKADPA